MSMPSPRTALGNGTGAPTPSSPPQPILDALRELGRDPAGLRLALRSDLSPDGRFGEQWLLLDDGDLWVLERPNGHVRLRYHYPLDAIRDAKVERCVGNGLFR